MHPFQLPADEHLPGHGWSRSCQTDSGNTWRNRLARTKHTSWRWWQNLGQTSVGRKQKNWSSQTPCSRHRDRASHPRERGRTWASSSWLEAVCRRSPSKPRQQCYPGPHRVWKPRLPQRSSLTTLGAATNPKPQSHTWQHRTTPPRPHAMTTPHEMQSCFRSGNPETLFSARSPNALQALWRAPYPASLPLNGDGYWALLCRKSAKNIPTGQRGLLQERSKNHAMRLETNQFHEAGPEKSGPNPHEERGCVSCRSCRSLPSRNRAWATEQAAANSAQPETGFWPDIDWVLFTPQHPWLGNFSMYQQTGLVL